MFHPTTTARLMNDRGLLWFSQDRMPCLFIRQTTSGFRFGWGCLFQWSDEVKSVFLGRSVEFLYDLIWYCSIGKFVEISCIILEVEQVFSQIYVA